MAALTATKFDYSTVDADGKSKLLWYAAEIRKAGVAHVEAGLEMGRMLAEARELCGEKPFREWAPAECGCSLRTAYNYMAAFSEFGECATVAHIELGAMYLLTNNDRAKKKAIKLSEKGITVTQTVAKKLVDESKPPAPKPPPPPPSSDPFDEAPFPPQDAVDAGIMPPAPESPDAASEPEGDPESPKPPRGRRAKPDDELEPCPNCRANKWTDDDGDGLACAKCLHPYGEPAGDVDDDRIKTQRQKTRKTAEALQRAFDDLHAMLAKPPKHTEAVRLCAELLGIAKGWK